MDTVREAERLEERGARIDRVLLDYDLKRECQKWLHERDRDRDETKAIAAVRAAHAPYWRF